ncbi:hypothetical protein [Paraflavitalea sp. CAU 1676]|uniref:hypothetical protein n=1 Tax=Paraflavitalea sp. CAU 1676 TaxID=3032598 RepID=UPI0023DB8F6B|nr:hypothetical protein [Paraflavitalea sp. CAU 1676]MDF2191172.1 hypothetical protein [Paraflavitalea sp. CAU 1676]
MKILSVVVLAIALMAATVTNVFDDLQVTEDRAKEGIIASFGGGMININYDVVKAAKALPVDVRVASTRQLIRFAKEYSKTPDFQKKYTKWRNERLGYKSKKFGLPSLSKALDNAVDKQLNKADDEKKFPAKSDDLIKQRLEKFLAISATVDFDAQLNGSMFANPEYESKSGEWKSCFRAGKAVVQAAREEAQAWLKELE